MAADENKMSQDGPDGKSRRQPDKSGQDYGYSRHQRQGPPRHRRTRRRPELTDTSGKPQGKDSGERQSPRRPHTHDRRKYQQETEMRKATRMAGLEMGSKSILNITNLAVIAVLIGIILFVIRIASVFGIFIFSFVIAFLLYPMVEWLNKHRIPRVWAILLVYILMGAVLFGILAAIVPAIITQANQFWAMVPELTKSIKNDFIPRFREYLVQLQSFGIEIEDIDKYIAGLTPKIQDWLLDMGQRFASGIQGAVGSVVTLLTVPIIVFYLLLDAPRIRSSLMKFAPPRTATEAQFLLNRLSEMLNHYLRGQLKLSFLMFLITTIALLILGVQNALLLGVLAGITEVIPIVGPILALIPAVLSSYFMECNAVLGPVEAAWIRAVIVFAFYMVLQWFEGNIMVPRIMGKDLNLHPLTVMFALLAGGYLAGIFGMLLGLPIAASLKVVFETYYPPFIQRVEDLVRQRPASIPLE